MKDITPPRCSLYAGYVGFHAFDTKPRKKPRWEQCRELFEDKWRCSKAKPFFFKGSIRRIRLMVKWVEDGFNLKQKYRTTIHSVGRGITLIEPSEFWTSHHMRRQFLTALLKGSVKDQATTPHSPMFLLLKNRYFMQAPRATAMFLTGFTVPYLERGNTGWVWTYGLNSNRDDSRHWIAYLRHKLRRPRTKRQLMFFRRGKPGIVLPTESMEAVATWVNNEERKAHLEIIRFPERAYPPRITRSDLKADCPFANESN